MTPRPTKKTDTLNFSGVFPIFDMETPIARFTSHLAAATSQGFLVVYSSRKGHFKSLSCKVRLQVAASGRDDGSQEIHEAYITFWLDTTGASVFSVAVPVPCSWTARLYMAVLRNTVIKRKLVILAPDNIHGAKDALTLNEVHWLFGCSVDEVEEVLNEEGHCFPCVNGSLW
eukprot:CAMPEP_0198140690 /NCGR_PEP_ID=MMETSP1443-20131203/3828_1 /TAXON_ID=186043 /ORGANISM="Entomoneis sp., Strain CCMP2396" /LENGTH=171 /DNA_ID=CAMNT_0043803201 /DNA_START=29 /DNA_END=544 /DNA_ORIENTATION=-